MGAEWFKSMICLTLWLWGWLGAGTHWAAQHLEEVSSRWHIARPGKDRASKGGFYWMHVTFAPLLSQKFFKLNLHNSPFVEQMEQKEQNFCHDLCVLNYLAPFLTSKIIFCPWDSLAVFPPQLSLMCFLKCFHVLSYLGASTSTRFSLPTFHLVNPSPSLR